MDDAELHWEVYERYISGQSYRRIADDLGIGKSSVPAMVRRVVDGEFGSPPEEGHEMLRGLARVLERNGWTPGQVMEWAALLEESASEELDPVKLAMAFDAFAKTVKGELPEYLSIAARLVKAEEAGDMQYTELIADYDEKLNSAGALEEGITELRSEEEELESRFDETRGELDQVRESLETARRELTATRGKLDEAEKRAESADKRAMELKGEVKEKVKCRDGLEEETGILRQAKENLIPEVQDLQAQRDELQRCCEAERELYLRTVSMRREAAAIAGDHIEETEMARDLVKLVAEGVFNPCGRFFHELRLAMAQADGTITEIESLALPSDAKEKMREALIRVLEENPGLPQGARDVLLRYTMAKELA